MMFCALPNEALHLENTRNTAWKWRHFFNNHFLLFEQKLNKSSTFLHFGCYWVLINTCYYLKILLEKLQFNSSLTHKFMDLVRGMYISMRVCSPFSKRLQSFQPVSLLSSILNVNHVAIEFFFPLEIVLFLDKNWPKSGKYIFHRYSIIENNGFILFAVKDIKSQRSIKNKY